MTVTLGLHGPEFTTLWVSDHFQFEDDPALECCPALAR